MSDPVTNTDIEDVLAQVRRLVLQEAPREASREASRGAPLAPRPAPAPRAAARLLLTPAQRVGEGDAEDDGGVPGAPDEAVGGVAPGLAAPPLASPDASAPAPALAGAGWRAQEARGIEAALQATFGDAAGASAWEPDGSEEPDWTLGGVLDEEPGDGAPPLFRHRARAAAPAAPEALTAPVVAPPGPERPVVPRPASAPPPLDEDRLRALVIEVVRAELQGEFGKRVTRNVRKLVRREVFRVLDGRGEDQAP